MKKLLVLALAVLMGFSATNVYAQSKKEAKREAKAIAADVARMEAEGWKVVPGELSLAQQLAKSNKMAKEVDELGYPKFIIGEAMSVGEVYDAAKMQANELAKLNLAGQIQSEIAALVKSNIGNEQLPKDDAASIAKTVAESQTFINQSLGRVIPVMACYRTKKDGMKEVTVRVAYSVDMAHEQAKKAIRQQLEKESEGLGDKLDQLLAK